MSVLPETGANEGLDTRNWSGTMGQRAHVSIEPATVECRCTRQCVIATEDKLD